MSESLESLGESFKRSLAGEGKAKDTIRLYMQAVRLFTAWTAARQEGEPTSETLDTPELVVAWFGYQHETMAINTVLSRWQGMNRFCDWLVDEEVIERNPVKNVKRPVLQLNPVPLLDDKDLVAIIKACQGKRFYDRRDEAVIRVLLDCGLRVSEVCKLTMDSLDLDAGDFYVHGKGGKQRMAYFGARTARALDRYKRMRARHRWAHLDALFVGERGALTVDGVREIVQVRATKAGVEGVHPHKFRHTWADDFLYSGGQERDLKRLAGWSSDVMLEIYGRSGADRRAKAAAQKMRRGDRV